MPLQHHVCFGLHHVTPTHQIFRLNSATCWLHSSHSVVRNWEEI